MTQRRGNRYALGASVLTIAICGVLACGAPEPEDPVAAEPVAEQIAEPEAEAPNERAEVLARAQALFRALPDEAKSVDHPVSDEMVFLGRLLFYDVRLSRDRDLSCNGCHPLHSYGVDRKKTSPGNGGQLGSRNSPSVYNAAFHITQFWDGRAKDVEEQAAEPILNPIEMAMPSEASVAERLASIPGYAPLFEAAFPEDEETLDLAHVTRAIGAFERRLTTPSRFDRFLMGDAGALTDDEFAGLETFLEVGCPSCHNGLAIGGNSYQKLGVLKPYPTDDPGRFDVTGNEADRGVFKVPSLRNVDQTYPYFHDGSITFLDEAIRIMAEHQLGRTLVDAEVDAIQEFLGSLTGGINTFYITPSALPESASETSSGSPG